MIVGAGLLVKLESVGIGARMSEDDAGNVSWVGSRIERPCVTVVGGVRLDSRAGTDAKVVQKV